MSGVASPSALAAWRRQLKPWLSALRGAHLRIDLPPLATVSDLETLWLSLWAPTERRNNPSVWTLLIEALELLELLARVDAAAAWRLLFDAAGSAHLVELHAQLLPTSAAPVLPRFLVHIDSDELLEETETTIQSCIRFIIVNEQTSSPKFARVRGLLLQQWQDAHGGRALDREVDGRVKISLNFRATMDFGDEAETAYVFTQIQNVAFAHADLSLLERVDRAAERAGEGDDQGDGDDGHEEEEGNAEGDDDGEASEDTEDDDERRGPDQLIGSERDGETETAAQNDAPDRPRTRARQFRNPNPPPRGPFVIESFRFELMDHPVSNMLLYMINEAGKSGMCMSHVTLSTLWHERLHHSVIGGFLLNQLVPWRGRRDILGISNLTLDVGGFDAAGVRAMCTAIAHSRSLREFQFRADAVLEDSPMRAEGDVWWPWLAYALFSGDADHQINNVWLNVESLETAHVDVIRQVLAHTDPLAFLFERVQGQVSPSSQATEAKAASLNPSALLRLGHHRVAVEGQDAPGVRVREPGVTYQVIRNRSNEDFIEILLPGTGVCWTERNEIIELKPLTQRKQHPIRKLTIELINDDTAPGVIALLPLVGEPLEHLQVANVQGTMSTAVFQAIRASCKNLKQLSINHCVLDTLDWLCDAEWTIESLVITATDVNDESSWLRLFTHLMDPSTGLSKTLRDLHLGLAIQGFPSCSAQDQILSMVGEMLEKNHRLRRCAVSNCVKNEFGKHKDRILAHHGEPICVEKAPLAREAKLAFLSATTPASMNGGERKRVKVSADTAPSDVSARTRFDPLVLRTIIEMAAETEHREVGICCSSDESQIAEELGE